MQLFRQTLQRRVWMWPRSQESTRPRHQSHEQHGPAETGAKAGSAPYHWRQKVPTQVCSKLAGKSLQLRTGTKETHRTPGRQDSPLSSSHSVQQQRHLSTSHFSEIMRNRGEEGWLGMRAKRFLKNSPLRVCFNFSIYGFAVSIT